MSRLAMMVAAILFVGGTRSSAGSVLFADSFDTDQGWSVTGDAFTGRWERGVPVDDSRGDPPVESGPAYVTENAPGNSDVDNGSTTLTSPLFNAEGEPIQIAFDYWLSLSFGGDQDLTDELLVEVLVDGTTWQEVERFSIDDETSEWTRVLIDGLAFSAASIDPRTVTAARFTVSDLGTQNVVEAGIDEFVVFVPEPNSLFIMTFAMAMVARQPRRW